MKTHFVLSDGMMCFGLWFAIWVFALKHHTITGWFPAVDQRTFR
jgi:hypothetical protein